MPRIDQFTQNIDKLHDSNLEMRECIRKLDSDISTKWSKSAMSTLVKELEQTYLNSSHQDDLEE